MAKRKLTGTRTSSRKSQLTPSSTLQPQTQASPTPQLRRATQKPEGRLQMSSKGDLMFFLSSLKQSATEQQRQEKQGSY